MNLGQKESMSEEVNDEMKKCCADCKTTKTPLRKGGPAGPKYSILEVGKTTLKKEAWSREEDQKLIDYINRYRIWIWSEMPKAAGTGPCYWKTFTNSSFSTSNYCNSC